MAGRPQADRRPTPAAFPVLARSLLARAADLLITSRAVVPAQGRDGPAVSARFALPEVIVIRTDPYLVASV